MDILHKRNTLSKITNFSIMGIKNSRILGTPTLLTDADSRTDINLKRKRDLSNKTKKSFRDMFGDLSTKKI